MISSPPKLRSDLIVRRQETANGTFFILKNPVTGDFFRFREAEEFIARQPQGYLGWIERHCFILCQPSESGIKIHNICLWYSSRKFPPVHGSKKAWPMPA